MPQSGPDFGQLPLLSETNTASESSQSIGLACPSSVTFAKLWSTPQAHNAKKSGAGTRERGGRRNDLAWDAEELRSSPVGSLANLIPLQESVRLLLTSVTCGESAPVSQGNLSLDGASLKTCRDFYRAREGHSSPALSVIWPRWGIAWDGGYGALTTLGRFTDATEFSSLDAWPTPTQRDFKSDRCTPEYRQKRDAMTMGKTLPWMVGGTLNPRWVEWLQGFPDGWTDLEPLETQSSHNKPIRSSKQSRKSRA